MEAALLFHSYFSDVSMALFFLYIADGECVPSISDGEFLFNLDLSFLLTDVIVLEIVCSPGARASTTSRDSSTGASYCWASVESDCF